MIRLCAALLAALLCCAPVAAQSAHDLLAGETSSINPRYLLQAPNGRSITNEDFRGRFQLISFGYTYCPDICPTSLTATAEGLKQLKPEELAQVEMLFISVDPERDTPARLKEYAEFFHPKIIGATGSPQNLAEIARRYGVFYARQKVETAGDGYVVDHTADTYVVDAKGALVGKIAHATPPDQVVVAIRKYLNPKP